MTTGSNGVPRDHTARVLREDPVRKGLLYLGTEFGMYLSFDDGKTWKRFQQNLPVTPVTDLKIFRGDLVLSTMGRGFWILDDITALRQEAISELKDKPHLFRPDTTIRYRYPMIRSTDMFPKYPVSSAYIDYYLPDSLKGGIKLEILGADMQPLVTVLSDSTQLGSGVAEVEDMSLSKTFRYVSEKLENKKGLNRFAWDLKQKGTWHKDPKRSYKNGPMLPPGTYTARLTAGTQVLEQPVVLVMDPRITAVTEADLEQQWAFQKQVIELHEKVRALMGALEKEVDSLKDKAGQEDRDKQVNSLLEQIKNDEGAYPREMLLSQVSYLYNMINGADQVPGRDALERYRELVSEFEALRAEAERSIQRDIN